MNRIIGLVLEDLFADYAKDIIHSIMNAIGTMPDIRLVVIAGKHNTGTDPNTAEYHYKSIYNLIYRLEEICPFDGLIVSLGGLPGPDMTDPDKILYGKFHDIPKVFITSSVPGEITVNYDNASGIREALDYLVKVEGFTKIGMLGGRDDNPDAVARKSIFVKCLEDNNLQYSDSLYEKTLMSDDCEEEAENLLDRNPDLQAVFCVNDAVAKGLYSVLKKRKLLPGRDLAVFGFDNTRMAADMIPPLSSVGSDSDAPGYAAIDLLLKMIEGETVEPVLIPTRLFGRESFRYEMYDYNVEEMIDLSSDFIDRMFDDCFYRYKNDLHDRENIDLKRLFHEFMSRILIAMKHRYMSPEEFGEIGHLIDIFFDNDAMSYTDSDKFVKSVDRIQGTINRTQKSVAANVRINRLFSRAKDRAIQALSLGRVEREQFTRSGRSRMKEFMINIADYTGSGQDTTDIIAANFDKMGFNNAALYLFSEPLIYESGKPLLLSDDIDLRCVVKAGELMILPKDRRKSSLTSLFTREELALKCKGLVALPVFYGRIIYGLIICELTDEVADRGDYVADFLGRMLYIANAQNSKD